MYRDKFSKDRMFDETFPISRTFQGAVYEIGSKTKDLHSEHEMVDVVIDIADEYNLKPYEMSKKELDDWKFSFLSNIIKKRKSSEKMYVFKAVNFIRERFADFQVYTGPSLKCSSLAFAYRKKPTDQGRTFLIFSDGIIA